MARILVVDDQPINRQFLSALLGYDGHQVLEATDGAEALRLVHAARPDLVVTDVVMPTMDGYEFVRQLRADPSVAHVPVILYTAIYQEKEARNLVNGCGGCHFLAKPSEPEAILRSVRAALGLASPAAPGPARVPEDFDREHLRLLTDTLSQKVAELQETVQRLEQSEQALRRSQQQLQAVNQTLEQRVAERTAEAERRATQLRDLATELTRAEHRERRRLALILHDHLQQLLVGAKFGTSILRNQINEGTLLHAIQHVDNLLDESLQASRHLTVELSPPILNQGSLVPALHWLAQWMHEKHGLHVHVNADEVANPQDEEVRILLFQAVRELLFNVVKHAKVSAASITMLAPSDHQVLISVVDRGVGFDVAAGTRRSDATTGLGLLSVRERLELLDGCLWIESAPGRGASITLVAPRQLPRLQDVVALPVEPYTAVEPVPVFADGSGRASRIRVLIADDHAVVRDGLTRLLQMHPDIEVIGTAADGLQAVERVLHLRPDVVLMDVSMPQMDGIEATRHLRAQMHNVYVIGLSMHAEEEMARRMREAGASHYLTKTAPPEEVVAAIRASSRTAA